MSLGRKSRLEYTTGSVGFRAANVFITNNNGGPYGLPAIGLGVKQQIFSPEKEGFFDSRSLGIHPGPVEIPLSNR